MNQHRLQQVQHLNKKLYKIMKKCLVIVIYTEKEDRAYLDSSANITKTDIRLSLIVISTDAGAIQLGKYLFMFYKQCVLNRGNC